MTAEELINMGLHKIGSSWGIADVAEESREAQTARDLYDHNLRAFLRTFPWPFATKYAQLYQTQGPVPTTTTALVQAWSATASYVIGDVVLSGGTVYYALAATTNDVPPSANWTTTATAEANGDWIFAFRWPSDCLFARRIVPPGSYGRRFNAHPLEFRIGRDANGLLVYTHQAEAVLEYTTLDCLALWTDDLSMDAFTSRLAWKFAPTLARDKDMEKEKKIEYRDAWNEAAIVASKESQLGPPGEADWIRDRTDLGGPWYPSPYPWSSQF